MGVGVGGGKRAWYPSGPRIDSDGNRTRTEYVCVEKEKEKKLPNPDPANYKIVKSKEIGDFLILKINYPDCTNFEGNKILVFKGVKPLDLLTQKLIDPHFFQNSKIVSPIARFTPTDQGWDMAERMARAESASSE